MKTLHEINRKHQRRVARRPSWLSDSVQFIDFPVSLSNFRWAPYEQELQNLELLNLDAEPSQAVESLGGTMIEFGDTVTTYQIRFNTRIDIT